MKLAFVVDVEATDHPLDLDMIGLFVDRVMDAIQREEEGLNITGRKAIMAASEGALRDCFEGDAV